MQSPSFCYAVASLLHSELREDEEHIQAEPRREELFPAEPVPHVWCRASTACAVIVHGESTTRRRGRKGFPCRREGGPWMRPRQPLDDRLILNDKLISHKTRSKRGKHTMCIKPQSFSLDEAIHVVNWNVDVLLHLHGTIAFVNYATGPRSYNYDTNLATL
ncbi:hypothetical protein CIB48_g7365 [Xylaria polymorpha]|nr:hypothetical protein CIB48_g7365 [Xylaria polymorpha]